MPSRSSPTPAGSFVSAGRSFGAFLCLLAGCASEPRNIDSASQRTSTASITHRPELSPPAPVSVRYINSITNLDVVLSETATGTKTVHFLRGSLAENIAGNVSKRLRGRTAATAMNMFASAPTEAERIVRNPDFWLADLPEATAYSAICAYGVSSGRVSYGVNATLITRRHFFQVKHNLVAIGSPVVYVTRDNRRIVRTVIDWSPVGKCDTNSFNGTNDCMVVQQLNASVPEDIVPLRLLPDDAGQYFGQLPPHVSGHQSKRFGIEENATGPFVSHGFYEVFRPLGGPLLDWYLPPAGGDSGSTIEYIINDHLVLALPVSSSLVTAIKVLNARHQTTELPLTIDLSMFPRVRQGL